MQTTKPLTFSAMMTALGILLMLMASMIPGVRLALTAVAGVVAALVVVQCGLGYGFLTVIATGILGLLMVPAKEIALLYLCFFGPYTIVKNLIERLHILPMEWLLKLLFCVSISALLYEFVAQILEMVPDILAGNLLIFLPAVAVVFVAYDIVFSKLIVYVFHRMKI